MATCPPSRPEEVLMSTSRHRFSDAVARNRERRHYRRDERAFRRVADRVGSDSAARELATIWAVRR